MSEFQPPDTPEEDIDAKWDAWFDQQEKNGYAVISRDEWKEKLDEAATDGYAEGRKDQLEDMTALIGWAYGKLAYRSFADMDDCLRMDEMKLILMDAPHL